LAPAVVILKIRSPLVGIVSNFWTDTTPMALVADDVREELTPQQLLQYEAMQTPDPLRASLFECRVAAQVSILLSPR